MRWRVLGLLVWAMTIGSFTVYTVAVLAPMLRADLGLSRMQLGALATASFVVAAGASPAIGRLIDRILGATGLALLFGVFIAAMAIMAGAVAYPMLLVAAALGGLAMGFANPLTNRIIAVHGNPRARGWLTGIKQSGGQLSAVLAGFGIPFATAYLGWRGAVAAAAVTGLLGLLLVRAASPEIDGASRAADEPGETSAPPPQHEGSGYGGERLLRWLLPYGLLMGAATGTVVVYLPLYAFEALGLSAEAAGATAGVAGVVGFAARISWGPIGERLGAGTSLLSLLALLTAASCGLLTLAESGPRGLLWVGIVAFGLSGASWNTSAMLVTIKQMPVASTGSASGRVLRWMYAGLLVSPPLMGWAVDRFGSYRWALLMAAAVALAAACTPAVSRLLPVARER